MQVVQHTSTTGTGTSLSATFGSPVTKGNLIVAVLWWESNSASLTSLSDSGGNSNYSAAVAFNPHNNFPGIYYDKAQATGSLTVTALVSAPPSAVQLHIYELSGVDTLDQTGTAFSGGGASLTVSTNADTLADQELIIAAFTTGITTQQTWTPGSGYAAGESTFQQSNLFSEYGVATESGTQEAAASASESGGVTSVYGSIATFYLSSSSGGTNFIGTVRSVASAPSGANNPFLGTFTVVGSAPAGANNPYLGSIVEVSGPPSPSNNNPALGEVVVVSSIPAGAKDVFLGSAQT